MRIFWVDKSIDIRKMEGKKTTQCRIIKFFDGTIALFSLDEEELTLIAYFTDVIDFSSRGQNYNFYKMDISLIVSQLQDN